MGPVVQRELDLSPGLNPTDHWLNFKRRLVAIKKGARKFRTGTQGEIDDFTDEELRARYRF